MHIMLVKKLVSLLLINTVVNSGSRGPIAEEIVNPRREALPLTFFVKSGRMIDETGGLPLTGTSL